MQLDSPTAPAPSATREPGLRPPATGPTDPTISPPVVAGFVLLLLLAIGVVVWQLWPSESEVIVVGDSVTVMSRGDLDDRVAGADLQFVAEVGYASADLLPLFEHEVNRRSATSRPLDRVALLVGYNDLLHGGDPATGDLDRMVALSSQFECGVWLTLPGSPGGGAAQDPDFTADRVDEWNRDLAAAVGRHPNLHLVRDWEEAVDAADGARYLDGDGVHPSGEGSELLADVYASALDRYC